ncbi:MAG: ABC transporter permease [Gemmatimonadaceae bacterium]|nr:ABC transporter permease [Gemmatimonadaceae bacterium]
MTRGGRHAVLAIGAVALAAVFVPLLAVKDPLAIEDVLATRLAAPFSRDGDGIFHVLGTDRFGRDLFVRTLLAARISLVVGVAGSLIATGLGVAIGAVSGWLGGVVDRLLMSLADALLAIPRLVLLLLCVALWAPGLGTVIVVLSVTGWMSVARLVRADVQGLCSAGFVDASRTLGAPGLRTLLRHVVPNATSGAMVAATLGVGNAILLESGLAFLGLGVQPPTPSWGNMIAGGRDLIVTAPWVALAPGLALIVTVLLCTVIGDGLRSRAGVPRSLGDRT